MIAPVEFIDDLPYPKQITVMRRAVSRSGQAGNERIPRRPLRSRGHEEAGVEPTPRLPGQAQPPHAGRYECARAVIAIVRDHLSPRILQENGMKSETEPFGGWPENVSSIFFTASPKADSWAQR